MCADGLVCACEVRIDVFVWCCVNCCGLIAVGKFCNALASQNCVRFCYGSFISSHCLEKLGWYVGLFVVCCGVWLPTYFSPDCRRWWSACYLLASRALSSLHLLEVCTKLKLTTKCECICKATCLLGNLFEMCWVLANENYQLTRPLASPKVTTQCHYVSRGITYVSMSWATVDFERAIHGPRN